MDNAALPLMSRIGTIFLTWRRHLQRGYARYGITLKQVHLLGQLRHREFLYPADIAEMLYCDRPTATVIIRNMIRKGWVRKDGDPQSRKRSRVQITAAGRRKEQAVRSSRANPERLSNPEGCLSKRERDQVARLLMKLHRHVTDLSA